MMVVNDLPTIKLFIQNSVELCRLHDYIRANSTNATVSALAGSVAFNLGRPNWYTVINSMYSSVGLVCEYAKSISADLNSLDTNFTLGSWHINVCLQHDVNNNNDSQPIELKTVLRRIRNAISHGKFELQNNNGYKLVFYDENRNLNVTDTKRLFKIEFNQLNLIDFLTKLDQTFNRRFP